MKNENIEMVTEFDITIDKITNKDFILWIDGDPNNDLNTIVIQGEVFITVIGPSEYGYEFRYFNVTVLDGWEAITRSQGLSEKEVTQAICERKRQFTVEHDGGTILKGDWNRYKLGHLIILPIGDGIHVIGESYGFSDYFKKIADRIMMVFRDRAHDNLRNQRTSGRLYKEAIVEYENDKKPHRVFCQDGASWHIEFDKEMVDLPDSKGLRYIHILLNRPNKDIVSIELYRLGNKLSAEKIIYESGKKLSPESEAKRKIGFDDELSVTYGDDQYGVLDDQAISQYNKRLKEIDVQLESIIDAGGDPADIEALEKEKEFVHSELSKSIRKGSSKNLVIDDAEKARQAITQAINRAYKNLGKEPIQMIRLVRYLRSTIHSGNIFIYEPEDDIEWEL